MRILIAGAGAVGGYFGGRLIEAGADITFLVRERRARQLEERGLVIRSAHGDFASQVPFIRWTDSCDPFDAAIICCKAFDLIDTTNIIKSRLMPHAIVLPLLNGMAHLEYLDAQLPSATVLGGTCHIGVTLDAEGNVIHLNQLHSLTYGARSANQ
ncbi:MAG: 2-dehydropantoate 2-reductase N-terminal domain-containing protein, partial [Steroidobacter sp.]